MIFFFFVFPKVVAAAPQYWPLFEDLFSFKPSLFPKEGLVNICLWLFKKPVEHLNGLWKSFYSVCLRFLSFVINFLHWFIGIFMIHDERIWSPFVSFLQSTDSFLLLYYLIDLVIYVMTVEKVSKMYILWIHIKIFVQHSSCKG